MCNNEIDKHNKYCRQGYQAELNESQYAAVSYCDGPSLVIAGAGSGKTRVLTYKIAYLLDTGYQPWNILALTFTNKAAREMKERIAMRVGKERAQYLWMGTFHSIFSRILRREAECIGFTSQFTIYDASDTKSIIRSIIKEMQLDEKKYKPGNVQARISNAKNHLVTPAAYAASREAYESDMRSEMPAMRDIYQRYWNRCRQAGVMDFDDLLMNTYLLFRDHPDVLERYQQQFSYVLVDEYQDTNFAQHSIVLQLTRKNQHVCVVGDDAQSIYSFRGAKIENILNFTKVYDHVRLFKLEQNYRSTQTIVSAANSLICKNEHQIPKSVFSEKEMGEPISVFKAYSDVEEGEIVANKIIELQRKEQDSYADFAILYRTNAQSRIFEEAFRKRGIPYRIYGGLSFYQRKEIKDVIAYFRLVVNPNDEEAFRRIINYPARGIGDTTINKIALAAHSNEVSLWSVVCNPMDYQLSVHKGTLQKLQDFCSIIDSFMNEQSSQNAYELGMNIVRQSGIMHDMMQDKSAENLSRKENVEELLNGLNDFCQSRLEEGNSNVSLADFLSEISLLTDQDTDAADSDEKVTLMTVHSAKGLEFKNVFVVGMEENLFPSSMAGESLYALEEERRLFYVAITRAEKHCFLSYAQNRIKYGKMEAGIPGRFLKDIDIRYLQLPYGMTIGRSINEGVSRFRQSYSEQYGNPKQQVNAPSVPKNLKKVSTVVNNGVLSVSSGSTSVTELKEGQQIEHERFGLGEVIKVEGSGENAKATIRFKNAGEKQLLLRFARFKVIE